MENLRWILIFAGVAILVLLYLSGRQKSTANRQRDSLGKSGRQTGSSRVTSHGGADAELPDPLMGEDFGDLGPADVNDSLEFDDIAAEFTEDPLERPGGPELRSKRTAAPISTGLGSTLSSKIEAFGERLSPKRKARIAASEPSKSSKPQAAYDSKIVTLHVVAPEGQILNGQLLLELFEQRGYVFGDMDIFHSMHDGKTVFSVAKLVVPGTFDINDIDSFQTPGISLILQLPGPVPADVAFEVLLSEASEMADTLGGFVLDADRSTLSKQTVQHMREGIYEYMHRQKYFSGVPS